MAFTKIHFSLGTYKKRNAHLVMLLKKYLLPALFVIAEAISDLPSQNVSVITSKSKIQSNFEDQPLGEFQKYFNISFCFRFMIQKWKSLTLIKTPQLELFVKNDDKFKGSFYLANSKMKGEGKETTLRFFFKPYFPRQWVSVCFSLKFSHHSVEVKGFQNGHLCAQIKTKVSFQGIYLKKNLEISHL